MANELTKPTGTKAVFVLQLHDVERGQEALCMQTNATTFYGIYNFRNVEHTHIITKYSDPLVLPIDSMKNAAARRLPRSRGTTSFARLMASANDEGFPLADHELDSDSDDSDEKDNPALPPYTTALDLITEGDEDEEADDGFVDVVNLGGTKYCRDPHSADHPECHGRFKCESYAHNAVDAELDFQERFVTAHNGRDSIAYYRNWRTLKLDHGEALVHGQSSLRNAVATPGEDEDDDELDDPTEQLLRLIAAKYGPLTSEGQKPKPAESERRCSEECNFKVDKYLDHDSKNDPWLSGQPLADETEELFSEPSTLFEGVADFIDDEALTPAPTTTVSQSRVVPSTFEEELEKVVSSVLIILIHTDHLQLLNIPHEDFVNHYVQRQKELREKAARAKQVRLELEGTAVTVEAINQAPDATVDTVPEAVVLPELIITFATPASSPIKEVAPLPAPTVVDHETIVHFPTGAVPTILDHVSENMESPHSCNVTDPVSAARPHGVVAPRVLPVCISHKSAPFEASVRPASASSSCSTRDGSLLFASVFSRQASVTTKPSNESFGSDHLRPVDALDIQVDAELAYTTVSHHERSVSMSVLTFPAPDTTEASVDVSEPNRGAHARSTYIVPSTPVRVISARNKCLTPIIEAQTPLSSSPILQATINPSTIMDDQPEAFSTTFKYQQPNVHISSEAIRLSREDEHPLVQPTPASLFTDDSSFTTHRQRSNKLATGIKYRAHAVASATKRFTRRALRSVKKLRTTARYFAPVTFGSRNPYETVSRG